VNNVLEFKKEELGQIRGFEQNGEAWFIGKDVAGVLGYTNSRKALADHVDKEDKGVTKCDTLGGKQDLVVINESGLYSLIFGSNLPKAKQFKRWVTSEVLPAIRKTGNYTAVAEFKGQEKMFRVLEGKVESLVSEAVREMEEKCSQFYRPASKEKSNISTYIKNRLGIAKANEEYELIKQRVLIKLGAEKWEDVPVETLVSSLDIIDESIRVIKADRTENQISFFEAVCTR